MVGLYYKRREERSQHKYLNLIGKCFLGFAGLVLIGVIFVVFFFNGERVKGPVSVYLSSKLDSPVTIGSADFSPLYPDVMRLSDVRFGGTRINELYVEYDLSSLFSDQALILNDLYINGLSVNDADIEKFKTNRFMHESIQIESLRLNHIPLSFEGLSSEDLNLRLSDVVYNNQGLTFSRGTLSALAASLYGEKVSNLSVEFKTSNQGYLLSNLSVNMLGGTVSGMGMFYPHFNSANHNDNTTAKVDKDFANANANVASASNSTRSASALLKEQLGLDISKLNFGLISSAHASEEPSAVGNQSNTNPLTVPVTTGKTTTATTVNTNPIPQAQQDEAKEKEPASVQNEVKTTASQQAKIIPILKSTHDVTVDTQHNVATNTFMAIPSNIENNFNAVGEKTKTEKQPIQRGFMGLVSNTQDPCAYQQVLSSMQPSAGHLDFDELYLTKLVLPRCLILPGNFAVTAKRTALSDVIITNQNNTGIKTGFLDAKKAQEIDAPKDIAPIDENTNIVDRTAQINKSNNPTNYGDYVIQGINGHINDLKVDQGQMLGSFVGTINEIAFPNLQTVFEQNRSSISFTENGLKFELKGNVYEGTYQVRGNYDKHQTFLTLSDLRLASNKLELTKQRWNFLKQGLSTYQVKLRALSFDKLEFLSYINDFPVSIQSISGNAASWQFNNPQRKRYIPSSNDDLRTTLKENRDLIAPKAKSEGMVHDATDPHSTLSFNIEGDPNAMLNIDLTNTLYSDLLMRKAKIVVSLSDDILNISVPKLNFNESELSAQASIGLVDRDANSYLTVTAQDFEIADLNSNLINHLLTGKVNLRIDLRSKYNHLSEMGQYLEGKVKLTSDALLISDLGIDLINGGPNKNYKLTGTELMTAVQGSVAGINNLNLDINFNGSEAQVSGQMGLATSNTAFEGRVDLQEHKTIGIANLVSLAQDSATQVMLSGSLDEPIFDIVALKRGEQRPGLYLPQYEASAIAKEQTDASSKHFKDESKDTTKPTTPELTENAENTENTEKADQADNTNGSDSNKDTVATEQSKLKQQIGQTELTQPNTQNQDSSAQDNSKETTEDTESNEATKTTEAPNDVTSTANKAEQTNATQDSSADGTETKAEQGPKTEPIPAIENNTSQSQESTTEKEVTNNSPTTPSAEQSEGASPTTTEQDDASTATEQGITPANHVESTGQGTTQPNSPAQPEPTQAQASTEDSTAQSTVSGETSDNSIESTAQATYDEESAKEANTEKSDTEDEEAGANANTVPVDNTESASGSAENQTASDQAVAQSQENTEAEGETAPSSEDIAPSKDVTSIENSSIETSEANQAIEASAANKDSEANETSTEQAQANVVASTDQKEDSSEQSTAPETAESDSTISSGNISEVSKVAQETEQAASTTDSLTESGAKSVSDEEATTASNDQSDNANDSAVQAQATEQSVSIADSKDTVLSSATTTDATTPDKVENASHKEQASAPSESTNESVATSMASKASAEEEETEVIQSVASAIQPQGDNQTATQETTETANVEETNTSTEQNSEQSAANADGETEATQSVANAIQSQGDNQTATQETTETANVEKPNTSTEQTSEQSAANAEVKEATQSAGVTEVEEGFEQRTDSQEHETASKSATPIETSAKTEQSLVTNETITESQQGVKEQAHNENKTTQIELKPSDSVSVSKPEDKPAQEQGSNISIAQGQNQSPEQKQAEMAKQADAIENNLLEQAAFDSFFSFDGFFDGEDEEEEEEKSRQEQNSDDYSFTNQDDEMIF